MNVYFDVHGMCVCVCVCVYVHVGGGVHVFVLLSVVVKVLGFQILGLSI